MPPIAQPPSHAPLLMQQPQPLANVPSGSCSSMQNTLSPPQMDVLSVSSKKLCSYCTNELGSGAAMIIENLGLFYHIFCFKCSVCHIPISDGNIHGTDVRVRNSRLHCQNCFSNEEGVKFSCVWLIYVGLNERRSQALMITELRELIFSIQFFKWGFILKHMSPTSPRKQSDYFSLNFLLFDELLNQRRKNTRKAQHKKKSVEVTLPSFCSFLKARNLLSRGKAINRWLMIASPQNALRRQYLLTSVCWWQWNCLKINTHENLQALPPRNSTL